MIEMETIMAEQIVKTEYSELMQKSYIDYSMSVITARALPDARDDLSPYSAVCSMLWISLDLIMISHTVSRRV